RHLLLRRDRRRGGAARDGALRGGAVPDVLDRRSRSLCPGGAGRVPGSGGGPDALAPVTFVWGNRIQLHSQELRRRRSAPSASPYPCSTIDGGAFRRGCPQEVTHCASTKS